MLLPADDVCCSCAAASVRVARRAGPDPQQVYRPFGEMGSDRGAVRGLWLAGVDLAASLSECHVAAPGPIETWTGRDGYCLLHESRPRLASELNNKKEGGGPISMQIIALPGSNHSEPSLEHCLLSSVDTMLQCCSLAWHERVHPCSWSLRSICS